MEERTAFRFCRMIQLVPGKHATASTPRSALKRLNVIWLRREREKKTKIGDGDFGNNIGGAQSKVAFDTRANKREGYTREGDGGDDDNDYNVKASDHETMNEHRSLT